MPNPTGNPYYDSGRISLTKMHDEDELKGLQVKAELNKLGAPPRSFSEYLSLDPAVVASEGMEDCAALGDNRSTLSDRFNRIEMARPAVHPVTINLARRLKNLQQEQSESANSSGAKANDNPEQERQQQRTTKQAIQSQVQQQRAARKQNRYRR